MSNILIIDPDLESKSCWMFTCDRQAITHDISIIDRILIRVPVCAYHKAHPCKGKVGMLSSGEVHYFLKFERIIKWLGKRRMMTQKKEREA